MGAAAFLLAAMLIPPVSMLARPVHAREAAGEVAAARVAGYMEKLPLTFVENRGQISAPVRYYVQGRDKSLYFTSEGITLALAAGDSGAPARRWVVKLDFVGAKAAVPKGLERSETRYSWFKGGREAWKTDIPGWRKVVYENLWPGIDLEYSGDVRRLKYQFVVHPGADPSLIRLAYRGASVEVDGEGSMVVRTPVASFADGAPEAWQEAKGRRAPVLMAYNVESAPAAKTDAAVSYGFRVGRYDRTRDLVLDPAILVYCGYLGGTGYDTASGIGLDAAGNAYVAGSAASPEESFPLAVGPDLTHNGGRDAFVAKVRADGSGVDWCGYIGGAGDDDAFGVAVDGAGNAYVMGETDSSEASFPVTRGPDLTYNGAEDVFVARVRSDGSGLDWCGYIGGSGYDVAGGIAVDRAGNAYVAGSSDSTEATFPVTGGPDLTHNGGVEAFVAKVSADGSGLEYCGYIGGDQNDYASGIALDRAGNVFVAGSTNSTEVSFPVAGGPDLTYNGGGGDAFVAKVRAGGSGMDYCGYIGGAGNDDADAIAVNMAGNAYVAGSTKSTEASFPVAVGPDLTANGLLDGFVARVRADGSGLDWCGYIGGEGEEAAYAVAVDGAENAYVTGVTPSSETSFPVSTGPDLTFNGYYDAFVARVRADGTGLDYCGYLGGSAYEGASGIAVDGAGNAYVAGVAASSEASFPVTRGPDLTHNGGVWDAFVAKVAFHHFADDFSDGTADGDPDWQEVSGDWGVTSTVAFAASATRRNVALVQGVALLDAFGTGTIEARIRLPRTSVRTPNGSIVFHYRDGANYRYVTLQKTSTGGKLIIGQVGDPAGDGSPGFRRSRAVTLRGRFQRMKVVLYPNGLLRVYRDGVLLRENTFSHVAPGRVGLAAVKSRTLFDDVVIR